MRDARAELAQAGAAALQEVGRFELVLLDLERDFQAAENERAEAYMRVATELASQIATLADLATLPGFLPYDPLDDDHSFHALFEAMATTAARSVGLLSLAVVGTGGAKGEELVRAKLRADIRAAARSAADPAWLIDGPPPRLRASAVKTVRALQERVRREASKASEQNGAIATHHLVKALAETPLGNTDVMDVFEKIKGSVTLTDLLSQLARLHEAGAIRLTIDVLDKEHGGKHSPIRPWFITVDPGGGSRSGRRSRGRRPG